MRKAMIVLALFFAFNLIDTVGQLSGALSFAQEEPAPEPKPEPKPEQPGD